MHATEVAAHPAVNAEGALELGNDVLESACLEPGARGLGVAVHRIAHPQHRATRGAHRVDQCRQRPVDLACAHAVDQDQPARLLPGIERLAQALHPIAAHRRPDLDAHRVHDAPAVLDVRALERRGAHADPGHVRREVVPAALPLDVARLRLLVMQVQCLVARIERRAARLVHAAPAHRFEEIQRVRDRGDELPVLVPQRRVVHEAEVPVLRVVQVREAAVDQRADEVERHRRALVAAQQQIGIGLARRRRELRTIHQVAPVARQGHSAASLSVDRTGLRVLPGETTHAYDRLLEPVQQHEAHLQEDLELACDLVRLAVREGLGAVATLQQEALAALCLGDLPSQGLDFPRHHDGRQAAECVHRPAQRGGVAIDRLLGRRLRGPARRRPLAAGRLSSFHRVIVPGIAAPQKKPA